MSKHHIAAEPFCDQGYVDIPNMAQTGFPYIRNKSVTSFSSLLRVDTGDGSHKMETHVDVMFQATSGIYLEGFRIWPSSLFILDSCAAALHE